MKRVPILFSLIVISFCFCSLVVAEQDRNTAKFETTILTEDIITYDFNSSIKLQSRKASSSCEVSGKVSECELVGSKSPNKNKLTCYSASDLFTSPPPGTTRLDVFECSSLDRKNCHRVYFLKQGKDYDFGKDGICISTDRKRVCKDNRDKYGASGHCYRFYDISIPSCDVKASIVVGNSKEAIANPKAGCSVPSSPPPPPSSPYCYFVPQSTESFENSKMSSVLEIFNDQANVVVPGSSVFAISHGDWVNYVNNQNFKIYDGDHAVASGYDQFAITFNSPVQSFNGYFGNTIKDPLQFQFYNSEDRLIYSESIIYDPVAEQANLMYYGYCSSENDIKKIKIFGYEQVMDKIGFSRSK